MQQPLKPLHVVKNSNLSKQSTKIRRTYRLDVKVQDFTIESGYVGEVRVETPIGAKVGDDQRPDWTRGHELCPRHLTQLQKTKKSRVRQTEQREQCKQ